MDMLVCCRDNGDEDSEEIQVPLFLEAGFVEDVRDSRKYTISEAVEHLQLPCEVKVLGTDCASDPLGCSSILTLETMINLQFLTISLAKEPTLTFDIPPQWLDMPLYFTGGPAKATPPTCSPAVEELTEAFYYHLLKILPSNASAPPRPPKPKDSKCNMELREAKGGEKDAAETSKLLSGKSSSTSREPAKLHFSGPKQKGASGSVLNNLNEYTMECERQRFQECSKPGKQTTGTAFSDDSDHDYEEINNEVYGMTSKLRRTVI